MLLCEKIRCATYVAMDKNSSCTVQLLQEDPLYRFFRMDPSSEDNVLLQQHPVASQAAMGAILSHFLIGNLAGLASTTIAAILALGTVAGPIAPLLGGVVGVVLGGLMAAGAVAHAAAPLVMGLRGKQDENPEGLCAKLSWGALDGLATPFMTAGYIGSWIGRVVGTVGGAALGASYGAARLGAAWAYEKILSPLLHCKPVELAEESLHKLTSRTHCPLPNYSLNANAAGQRLRNRFNKTASNPAETPFANSNVNPFTQPRSTGTSGPQNE